jgi:hypothetical protein
MRAIGPQHRNLARHTLLPGKIDIDAANARCSRIQGGDIGGDPAKARRRVDNIGAGLGESGFQRGLLSGTTGR